jgi:hypothetical protein
LKFVNPENARESDGVFKKASLSYGENYEMVNETSDDLLENAN